MDSAVRAALSVLELSELPKTQEELKAIYRKHVKRTHPDISGGNTETKSFHRVQRASQVLSDAINEASVPCVYIKFGEGESQKAKVVKRQLSNECSYLVALHWFTGLMLQVGAGEWKEIKEPENFKVEGIQVIFV